MHTVYLEITPQCNMCCPGCNTRPHRAGVSRPPLDLDEVRDLVLAPMAERGARNLILSGGEPTLCTFLEPAVADALALDYSIVLATNLLSFDEGLFGHLLDRLDGPEHAILVSFDSILREEMNSIRGGLFYARVHQHLLRLIALRERVCSKTRVLACLVLQQQNAGSALETVEVLLEKIGVDQVVVQPLHPFYRAVTIANAGNVYGAVDRSDSEEQVEAARRLFRLASNEPRLLLTGPGQASWQAFLVGEPIAGPACRSPSYCFIDPFGRLRGCLFGSVLGDLRAQSLDEYVGSTAYRRFLEFAAGCRICVHGCS